MVLISMNIPNIIKTMFITNNKTVVFAKLDTIKFIVLEPLTSQERAQIHANDSK